MLDVLGRFPRVVLFIIACPLDLVFTCGSFSLRTALPENAWPPLSPPSWSIFQRQRCYPLQGKQHCHDNEHLIIYRNLCKLLWLRSSQFLDGLPAQFWCQMTRRILILNYQFTSVVTLHISPLYIPCVLHKTCCVSQAFLCTRSRPGGQSGDRIWPRKTWPHRFAWAKVEAITAKL